MRIIKIGKASLMNVFLHEQIHVQLFLQYHQKELYEDFALKGKGYS